MISILSLLVIVTLSILITRIATVALVHTGLGREAARFQARSAFTGAGFTTTESEQVVSHPVRRRIVLILMFLGNAGIVTAVSSLILTFVDQDQSTGGLALKIAVLLAGLAALWMVAASPWVDRHLSRLIQWALARYTSLDVRDYAKLMQLRGEYELTEFAVQPDDWLAHRTLQTAKLRDEGIVVLGIQREDGKYLGAPNGESRILPGDKLILYGRSPAIAELDERKGRGSGDRAHEEAVAEQAQVEQREKEEDAGSTKGSGTPPG